MYPFASSLRDGKVRHIQSSNTFTHRSRASMRLFRSQMKGITTRGDEHVSIFFFLLGGLSRVEQQDCTGHTLQDAASHDHSPCNGRSFSMLSSIRNLAHDTLAHALDKIANQENLPSDHFESDCEHVGHVPHAVDHHPG